MPDYFSIFGFIKIEDGVEIHYISSRIYDYPELYDKQDDKIILPAIIVEQKVVSLGAMAFNSLRIKKIQLPQFIKYIDHQTFSDDIGLETIIRR